MDSTIVDMDLVDTLTASKNPNEVKKSENKKLPTHDKAADEDVTSKVSKDHFKNIISSSEHSQTRAYVKNREIQVPRFLPLKDVSSFSRQNANFSYLINKKKSLRSTSSSKDGNNLFNFSSSGELDIDQDNDLDHDKQIKKCDKNKSLITDQITDVRQMEQGLLQLLDSFHSGQLQAFGKDITFEKMEAVREQQERLARLHFDLMSHQHSEKNENEESRIKNRENMSMLMSNLQNLSSAIEQLQSTSSSSKM